MIRTLIDYDQASGKKCTDCLVMGDRVIDEIIFLWDDDAFSIVKARAQGIPYLTNGEFVRSNYSENVLKRIFDRPDRESISVESALAAERILSEFMQQLSEERG